MKYNCLIIDDEKILANSTAEYFNLFGVNTFAVYGAEECHKFFDENDAELILLDINLGDGNGFELCKELRETMNIPILFISARTSDDDKIVALNIGGDDYIQKPYSLGVLLAKVKAVLKRFVQAVSTEYSDGYLMVNFEAKQAYVRGNCVKLTSLEFKLLAYLIENKGKVISKKELFENVWKDKFTGDGTLNVHIRRLREAIESNPNDPRYIVTIWGDGYKFTGENK
ncbi:MAG: response regulator transcription factor [Anaeroplasmataceae bacterium]|nr:response regulator transcription factor [Anaeroplasmataceae bacterium]